MKKMFINHRIHSKIHITSANVFCGFFPASEKQYVKMPGIGVLANDLLFLMGSFTEEESLA